MGYRWKPSRSQKRDFAQRMQDPEERAAYYQRKEDRKKKNKASSKFDYETAGGNYVPTQHQYETSLKMLSDDELTSEQKDAANQVIYGYTTNEKIHHDYIHLVNEWERGSKINENEERFVLNGGFYWQPDNENQSDFLGEDEEDSISINKREKVSKRAGKHARMTNKKQVNNIKEDMTTANIAVSDEPITNSMKTRVQNYDPYKGAQNVAKNSKTIIGKDDNFLNENVIRKILNDLYEDVKYPLGKSFNATPNIEHEITNPYEGNIFDDEESEERDKTKIGKASEYENNEEIKNILESLFHESSEKFDTKERKKLTSKGEAEKDGSFPIRNTSDLKNAIHDYGRAGHKESDKNWIKKRAKELGAEDILPDNWKKESVKKNKKKLKEVVSDDNVQILLNKYDELKNKGDKNLTAKDRKILNYISDELTEMGYSESNETEHKNEKEMIDSDVHKEVIKSMNDKMKGKRVELIFMDDKYTNLKPGDKGTISSIDDLGDIHVEWDNGSTLALVPEVDKWKILNDDEDDMLQEVKKKTKKDRKFDKVMGEWKKGTLHSHSKHGPKVKSQKQALAIAFDESRKDEQNESNNENKLQLSFLQEGKLKGVIVNENKFSNFVRKNCDVKKYINEKNELNIDAYLSSRTISFKQQLIKEYISLNQKNK